MHALIDIAGAASATPVPINGPGLDCDEYLLGWLALYNESLGDWFGPQASFSVDARYISTI